MLIIPANYLNKIGIGKWQGVNVIVNDNNTITITKAHCKHCGGDTYLSKSNEVCCVNCKQPISIS